MTTCPSNRRELDPEAVYQSIREFMQEAHIKTFPTQELLREYGRTSLFRQIGRLGGSVECAEAMGVPLGKFQVKKKSDRQSLCWQCKHAVPNPRKGNGCEWSIDFRPVRGWEATKKEYRVPKCNELMISYNVHACPKFVEG